MDKNVKKFLETINEKLTVAKIFAVRTESDIVEGRNYPKFKVVLRDDIYIYPDQLAVTREFRSLIIDVGIKCFKCEPTFNNTGCIFFFFEYKFKDNEND